MQNQQNEMSGEKSVSNPDLSLNMENSNVNTRKRKGHTDLDDMTSLQSEIKDMLHSFKVERTIESAQLFQAIEEIRAQNKEIIKTNNNIEKILEQTTSMYNNIKEKVDKISTEHEDALLKINNLEIQVEELQRAQKVATVEIRNIPVTENEDIRGILNAIHNSLQLPLSPNDIKQVRRLKNNQNTIIAEFETTQQSKALLNAVKQYNKLHPEDKFNTVNLNMEMDKFPVYISEALTPRGRKLHFLARDLRKNFNYKHCWIWQGRVFVKKTDSSQIIWIKSEQQIETLKSSADQ